MSSSINLKLGAHKATAAGRPDASAIEMERRIIWIRWLAILVSLGALPFLSASLNRQSLVTLLALIGLGAIYNLTLLVVLLPRKPEWLTSGYISAVGDRARRAERALQEELERAHASLSEVTVELNRDLEFEQTCQLTADKGRSLLSADAFLMQVQMPPLIGQDEATPPASMLYVDWTPELKAQHAGVDLTTARLALTPATGEQVIAVADPNLLLPNEHKPLPAGMWFRIPVFHGARAIADMIVGFMGREQPLRQTEMELMLTFAERAGIAMRNAHALDQAQKLSVTDSVTGLPNHRYFHTRFDEEMEKTKDTGGSITVMMINLDRFKVYNDSFGHAAGDLALQAAARTISSTMRREDTVTRYGGEEFVAILPGVDIQTAPIRAQELCDTLSKVFMYNPKTIFPPPTASA